MKETILKDALYNLTPGSGAKTDYCRGLIIGIVSALMAQGKSHIEAAHIIRDNLPKGYRVSCIPSTVYLDMFCD